ncbi:hypothetical protein E4T48_07020 [Aureobasidium sp. EXF-10727]|nr:hypothetical protein E4T48_07020 [Aureobasidium sp. EXF-10727]KAI4724992.1 hypothetical protein E4T49_07253 [Aureobasidium sp. EXF-10728]
MSLSSLPPEIFNAVLDGVSGRDVMNLRLVCRRTSALSSHQFGVKCLTDLSFIWSPYSLQGLLDLSVHPLGRYLKRLTLATHFIHADKLTEDPIERQNARLETTFEQWERRIVPLVRALENFKKANVQLILGSYDYHVLWTPLDDSIADSNNKLPRKGYGYDKYYGSDATEPLHASYAHANRYILKAAQQARLANKTFHIQWNSQSPHEEDDFNFIRHQLMRSEPGSLNPDIELQVTISYPNSMIAKVSIDTKSQKYQFCTLPLEGIALSTHPRAPLDRDRMFIDLDVRNCFREIRLSLCDTDIGLLTTFLTNQRKSLRVLHLEHVTLDLYEEDADVDPGNLAMEFLQMLRDDLCLEFLKLTRLSFTRDRSRLIGGHDDTWMTAEEVKDGLQMYIQREEDDEHSVDEEWSDDDEAEWISVHHSEDEDEEEVWPGPLEDEDNEITTDRQDVREGEESEA